ncbi:unnamed protein product, partial [Soboliphyme baturini]|uniref:ATP synthase subunit s, mitochondrial n=1 Tax=Soboliphyme baturini TaxID=241478 RepID=A0A183IUT6_9BILA
MSFETLHLFAQLRYLNLEPSYIKRYYRYQNIITLQYDQRFIPERQLFLGADLAAAHFIVHRGGSVKFLGDETWHRRNDRGEYILPGKRVSNLFVEAIDASNTFLMFEGFSNLHGLRKLRYLRIADCPFISDWCMSKMSQFSNSLEYLDLSGCSKLTASGISGLSCLKYVFVFVAKTRIIIKMREKT